MFARCGVSVLFLWLQLLRCWLGWPALQSTSAGGRLSQFPRESACSIRLMRADRCATREVTQACSNAQPWLGRSRRRPQPRQLFVRLGSRFSIVAA